MVSLRTVLLLRIDGCGRCLDLLSRQLVCWTFSVFSVTRDGFLSFSISVLWLFFVVCDWWTLLDNVDW